MKSYRPLVLATLALSLAACYKSESPSADTAQVVTNVGPRRGNTVPATTHAMTLSLTSPAFAANASMATRYTCEGGDISPPLQWTGAPKEAKSLALIVEDPDAPDPAKPTRVVSHWVLYNIPPTTTSLAEDASKSGPPFGAQQGANERNVPSYMGPCPPIGRHRYFFKLFALDTELTGLNSPKKAELESAMQGHIIGSAELIGTYQKTKK